MADFAFNISKGTVGYYAKLPAANDALVLIPLAATGLGTDATLRDLDTLAQVLANATEQTTMGRKVITTTTVTVDDANDRVDIDFPDPTWTAPSGVSVGKLLLCYDPDTTTGTDADLILLTAHDFAVTPDGSTNIIGVVAASGFFRVA